MFLTPLVKRPCCNPLRLSNLAAKLFRYGLQLQRLAELVVTGRLQVRVAKEYPFEEIQAACDYVATGHADGKVIIKLTD